MEKNNDVNGKGGFISNQFGSEDRGLFVPPFYSLDLIQFISNFLNHVLYPNLFAARDRCKKPGFVRGYFIKVHLNFFLRGSRDYTVENTISLELYFWKENL